MRASQVHAAIGDGYSTKNRIDSLIIAIYRHAVSTGSTASDGNVFFISWCINAFIVRACQVQAAIRDGNSARTRTDWLHIAIDRHAVSACGAGLAVEAEVIICIDTFVVDRTFGSANRKTTRHDDIHITERL